MQGVEVGRVYRHFKGDYYLTLCLAYDCETLEEVVVYKALYGNCSIYTRKLSDFTAEVNKEKYPNVNQQYRFELQDIKSVR